MQALLDGDTLLTLWEHGLAQPATRRADALLHLAQGERAPTLGQRNARLARLHAQWFGAALPLRSHCPACGASAEFSGDCDALADAERPLPEAPLRLQCGAHAVDFRLPVADDVAVIAACADDEDDFARRLLLRCVLACTRDGHAVPPDALPPEALDALSQELEALDPSASVSFLLSCPACQRPWDARLDLAQLVWQKLQVAAERLLLDIDMLARHYGWTERDVLALSATRRAAYVQMAAT